MSDRVRRGNDPWARAEAAFKAATVKAPEPAAPRAPAAIPGAREQVTLRIDRDVLEFFQADGAGWQERINAALKRAVDDKR